MKFRSEDDSLCSDSRNANRGLLDGLIDIGLGMNDNKKMRGDNEVNQAVIKEKVSRRKQKVKYRGRLMTNLMAHRLRGQI